MPGVEALIDAVLVLDHGRLCDLTPLADGSRLAAAGGGWRIDTDLLRLLIDRLGTFEEVMRPLSEQVGRAPWEATALPMRLG